MPPSPDITWIHWTGFIAAVIVFLALDLGVFHRRAHTVTFREALIWSSIWFTMAMIFGFTVFQDPQPRQEFITGYILELSLSMDNVFVIALIFRYFRVEPRYQHRVLFWGILGALVMRGIMIALGAALVRKFDWILILLGLFLLLTAIKMLFVDDEGVHPEKNPLIKLARKWFPVAPAFDGQKFTTMWNGSWALTPLALVLVMVETTDLAFAIDSIPAIFGVTENTFIIFTSNIFAILGLRSLYFVLSSLIGFFAYLKYGLSLVLAFVGGKMIAHKAGLHLPIEWSLGIIAGILLLSIALSVAVASRRRQRLNIESQGDP